ncbi:ferredoxin [uncultured Microbacterium sp.]|uniref:ferredoxin n=1 Tax=uncultured Microbacterium sp. TaxID=191216 RepID=UPI0026095F0C|nr:ferredoxin [uncultured Microbacterium sp.]
MTYVIAQPCVDVKDKACVEECPVEAIYYEDDVPDQWAEYYKANVEFFDELGSPGGAVKLGNTGRDHPLVAALPPQNQDIGL